MTTVRIKREHGSVVKVDSIGHAGYSVDGEDIVCAGISSILQTALLGLIQVAQISLDYKVDAEIGRLTFGIPDGISETQRHDADVILETMLCGIADLSEGYSEYIKLEVK